MITEKEYEEDNLPPECPICIGTGIGQYSDTNCTWCNGTGIAPRSNPDNLTDEELFHDRFDKDDWINNGEDNETN